MLCLIYAFKCPEDNKKKKESKQKKNQESHKNIGYEKQTFRHGKLN